MKNRKMKILFGFVPATLLVLFLLNSFVIKEKKTSEKTTGASKLEPLNIVYRSADGGKTWQNISEGLPERLRREGVPGNGFFANDDGLYLRAGNGLYHSKPNSKTSFWTKVAVPNKQRNITPGNNGIFAYNFRGQILKKADGTNEWSPMYTDFQEQAVRIDKTIDWMYTHFKEREVRTVFETAGGTVFIGSNNMLFRSANSGKTWEQVQVGDGRMKLVESNGVLLSTSHEGILRSTDDGQTWERVINEGGEGIAVERIDGGFAAIVHNVITQTNRIHLSMDNGKTWKSIGEGPLPSWNSSSFKQIFGRRSSLNVFSIKQVGKHLICGRSDGIFSSSDMGKTWELLFPSMENFGFNISVSGNVIYAAPNKGC